MSIQKHTERWTYACTYVYMHTYIYIHTFWWNPVYSPDLRVHISNLVDPIASASWCLCEKGMLDQGLIAILTTFVRLTISIKL